MMKSLAALTISLAATATITAVTPTPASAAAAAEVYAGMPIAQGDLTCTMTYADPVTRIGYAAGHCRQSPILNNEDGDFIGTELKGLSIVGKTAFDYTIDYEKFRLAPGVTVVDDPQTAVYGPLLAYTGIKPAHGMIVCHDGATTGHSCGQISVIYDGSFSMTPGPYGDLTSDAGDSGGPVYALVPGQPGRVLVGIFQGRRGALYMAVSWTNVLAMT
jgi:hypothetical protein